MATPKLLQKTQPGSAAAAGSTGRGLRNAPDYDDREAGEFQKRNTDEPGALPHAAVIHQRQNSDEQHAGQLPATGSTG